MTGKMYWLEIQEGKHRMRALGYTHELDVTAACVMGGVVEVSHFSHHRQSQIESIDTPYRENLYRFTIGSRSRYGSRYVILN